MSKSPSFTAHLRGAWSPLALVLATLGAVACAPSVSTHGYRVDEARLAQIEPGRSTRDEVLQLLGSPTSSDPFDDSAWYYISQRNERMSFYQDKIVQQDVIALNFDEQGVVRSMARHGLERAHQIEPVERETPTSGSELSAWQQFIGNIGRFNPEAPEADQAK